MGYGFIFDLDGLLVYTQKPFHATAESMVFAEYGLNLKPDEISERFAGISTRKIFTDLLPEEDVDILIEKKWKIMYKLLETNPLVALPGMLEICDYLKSRAVPIIIASASPKSWIQLCLDRSIPPDTNNFDLPNFSSMFGNNFVSAEECLNGKPAPDIFLLAKSRLAAFDQTGTIKWIVVGDGTSDVIGGLAAEMDVLFLSESNTNFDSEQRVKRFSDSVQLAGYIKNLVTDNNKKMKKVIIVQSIPSVLESIKKKINSVFPDLNGLISYQSNFENTLDKIPKDEEIIVIAGNCYHDNEDLRFTKKEKNGDKLAEEIKKINPRSKVYIFSTHEPKAGEYQFIDGFYGKSGTGGEADKEIIEIIYDLELAE